MAQTDHDVYVSFARPDASLGEAICHFLDAAGLRVATAPEHVHDASTPWLAEVARRVHRSRKLVLIITDRTPVGWMTAEIDFAMRQVGREVIPIIRAGATAELPASFVPIHLPSDHSALSSTLAELGRRAKGGTQPPTRAPAARRPFPGLRPFGLHDGRWFFGRDRDITEATRLLGRDAVRWLRIEGSSGVGKTSFARAGVCGAILRGACGGPIDWSVVAFRPGLDPMRALIGALVDAFSHRFDAATVEAALDKRRGLTTFLNEHLPAHAGMLMIIDHIDDLATSHEMSHPGVAQFDALLGRTLADGEAPLVLITTGSTSQSRRTLDVLPKLVEVVPHSVVFTLGGLMPRQIKRVIEGPLALANTRWPAPLIERLVADAARISGTPGPLAWLLARLYRTRRATLAEYEALGGLQYGPGRAFDSRLDTLEDIRRDRTLTLLLSLITAGRGRNDAPIALLPTDAEAIAGGGPEGAALVRGLAHGAADAPDPLLVQDASDSHIRLAHSELLRIWPRLRGLLASYRVVIERRADIERRAAAWNHGGRNPGLLPDAAQLTVDTGADLPEAQRERLRAILSTEARAYVGAAEETAHALEDTQSAVSVAAQRRVAAEAVNARGLAAEQNHKLKIVFFSAVGGIILLLGLLVVARRDAADAHKALENARATHAQTADALANRTADKQALNVSRDTLDKEKQALDKTVDRARKTTRLAATEAAALLQFAEDAAQDVDTRFRRWSGAAGTAARRGHALWAAERLAKSLEGNPRTDRLRLLTVQAHLRLAQITRQTGPRKAVGAHFGEALRTLAPLTGRDRPSPPALEALADVHGSAAAFYLSARASLPQYRDVTLAQHAAQQAVAAWRRLVKLYPQQPRNQAGLFGALSALGRIQLGDKLDAIATLRAAVREGDQLVEAAPKDFDRRFKLGKTLTLWGEALSARGRKAEARAALTQATNRLREAEPLAAPGQRSALDSARQRTRRLLGQLSQ